jgi:hypothetical protein
MQGSLTAYRGGDVLLYNQHLICRTAIELTKPTLSGNAAPLKFMFPGNIVPSPPASRVEFYVATMSIRFVVRFRTYEDRCA